MKVKELGKKINMNEVIERTMENDESWWGDFVRQYGKRKALKKAVAASIITDEDSTEENLKQLDSIIDAIPEGFEDQVETIRKKYRVLEKRVERRISEEFGALLRHHRTAKGMSLAQLGREANISPSYINRFETGERQGPSLAIVEALADALDISIIELIGVSSDETNGDEPQSLIGAMFSNSIYIKDENKPLSRKEKQALIDLINLIYDAEWKDDKHKETMEIINQVDKIKNIKK